MFKFFKVFFALLILTFIDFRSKASADAGSSSVRIIQLIEHPALDETRRGIIEALSSFGINDCSWESAQGSSLLSAQIIEKFLGQKPTVIVAIATLPAQIALKLASPLKVPVIYTSVTNPNQAKLSGLITGVSNFIDVKKQLEFIQKILPSLKKLGIIYNPGEVNSQGLLEITTQICKEQGIVLIPTVATKTSDVSTAMDNLVGKVEAVFINNDNTALAAFDAIVKIATPYKIPVFSSDTDLITKGALAAIGPNQYDLGQQTGKMIYRLLKGESVQDIAPEMPAKTEIKLNFSQAKEMGVEFPTELIHELSQQELSLKAEAIP